MSPTLRRIVRNVVAVILLLDTAGAGRSVARAETGAVRQEVISASAASVTPPTDSVLGADEQSSDTVGTTVVASGDSGDSNWPWVSAAIGLGIVLAMVIVGRLRTLSQRRRA